MAHPRRFIKLFGGKESVGSELLDTIAFAAEFTFSRRLGFFYSNQRLAHCRSPPLFWFLKKIKAEVKNEKDQFAGLLPVLSV